MKDINGLKRVGLHENTGINGTPGKKIGPIRQQIIEEFLPRSQCHLVAQLPKSHLLENGAPYDHLIIARYISFTSISPCQSLVLYFSKGLPEEGKKGLANYEMEVTLTEAGDVMEIATAYYEKVGKLSIEKATSYLPSAIEPWKMEAVTSEFDELIKLIPTALRRRQLPEKHFLMQEFTTSSQSL